MTLQQPKQRADGPLLAHRKPILCHKCGNPVVFDKNHVAPSGRKIPLEPNTDQPHIKYCMYSTMKDNPHTEALFIDFLSKVPYRRPRKIIGVVGRAR